MTVQIYIRGEKGGPGSGNWGHTGRPGLVGGSGGGAGIGVGPESPGQASGGIGDAQDFLNDIVDDYGTPGGENWLAASQAERESSKRAIVSELAERSGVDSAIVNQVIKQWAGTSNDENMKALSLQEAAAEELGLKMSDWQQEKLDTMIGMMEGQYNDYVYRFNIAKHTGDVTGEPVSLESFTHTPLSPQELKVFPYQRVHTPITSRANERAIIRAMYDNTQEQLAKAGYESGDTISLSRGITYDSDPGRAEMSIVDYKGNSMESWSVSDRVAMDFATDEGSYNDWGEVVSMAVPVSSIVGTARTGFGCLTEGEFVIAGNVPGSKATVWEAVKPYSAMTVEESIDAGLGDPSQYVQSAMHIAYNP